jgi:serine/threonine protein kinase
VTYIGGLDNKLFMWVFPFQFKYAKVHTLKEHAIKMVVYRHRWKRHHVVVKKIPRSHFRQAEVRALKTLATYEGTQDLHEVYESPTTVTLVLRAYYGWDLAGQAWYGGPIAVQRLMYEMCCCVEHCHRYGIVHTDVSLEKFMMHKGRAVLIGFGHAHWVDRDELYPSTLALGTEGYRAPEVKEGRFGFRSDVYSLGVVYRSLCEDLVPLLLAMTRPRYGDRPTIWQLLQWFQLRFR